MINIARILHERGFCADITPSELFINFVDLGNFSWDQILSYVNFLFISVLVKDLKL